MRNCAILSKHLRDEAKCSFSKVGVYCDEGPPVPIPNTVVKLMCAENTWLEAARENRSTPTSKGTFRLESSFFMSKNE